MAIKQMIRLLISTYVRYFLKIEEEFWPILKTFLVYLSYMPEIIDSINGRSILSDDIQLDQHVVDRLRIFDREN